MKRVLVPDIGPPCKIRVTDKVQTTSPPKKPAVVIYPVVSKQVLQPATSPSQPYVVTVRRDVSTVKQPKPFVKVVSKETPTRDEPFINKLETENESGVLETGLSVSAFKNSIEEVTEETVPKSPEVTQNEVPSRAIKKTVSRADTACEGRFTDVLCIVWYWL